MITLVSSKIYGRNWLPPTSPPGENARDLANNGKQIALPDNKITMQITKTTTPTKGKIFPNGSEGGQREGEESGT
jgi:hypothetical protein